MTWTYSGAPDSTTTAGKRDAVRFLVGDTDTTNQQVTDEEISFTLTENNDDVYLAGAVVCQTLASKYAYMADTNIETVRIKYQQIGDKFIKLASRLKRLSKSIGSSGLGVPSGGGISQDTVTSVNDDTDRVVPSFTVGMFEDERS